MRRSERARARGRGRARAQIPLTPEPHRVSSRRKTIFEKKVTSTFVDTNVVPDGSVSCSRMSAARKYKKSRQTTNGWTRKSRMLRRSSANVRDLARDSVSSRIQVCWAKASRDGPKIGAIQSLDAHTVLDYVGQPKQWHYVDGLACFSFPIIRVAAWITEKSILLTNANVLKRVDIDTA